MICVRTLHKTEQREKRFVDYGYLHPAVPGPQAGTTRVQKKRGNLNDIFTSLEENLCKKWALNGFDIKVVILRQNMYQYHVQYTYIGMQ